MAFDLNPPAAKGLGGSGVAAMFAPNTPVRKGVCVCVLECVYVCLCVCRCLINSQHDQVD